MDSPPFPAAAIEAAREAAKAQLRIEGASEDALVAQYAASALALCEAFTGTAWIAREFVEIADPQRRWHALAMAPVTAVTAVTGPAGEALPADGYAIDVDAGGTGWVRAGTRVRVAYGAGAAAGWGDLPPPIAQGVVLLVAHLFEGRTGPPPAVVSALWRPWRRLRLAAAERAA